MPSKRRQHHEDDPTATFAVRNGIDVDQLVATIGAITEQPSV